MIPRCKLFRKIKEMPCVQRWDKVGGLSVVDPSGSMQSVVKAQKLIPIAGKTTELLKVLRLFRSVQVPMV